jgi:pyruvate carboxylase
VATLHAVSDAAKLQYPGRVKAAEENNLAFKVSGRIERILVKEGDYVKAGQLVALIDPSDYDKKQRVSHKFWGALFFLQKVAVLFCHVGYFSYLCICKSI